MSDGGVGTGLGNAGDCQTESLQDCLRSEHLSLSFERGQSQRGYYYRRGLLGDCWPHFAGRVE